MLLFPLLGMFLHRRGFVGISILQMVFPVITAFHFRAGHDDLAVVDAVAAQPAWDAFDALALAAGGVPGGCYPRGSLA